MDCHPVNDDREHVIGQECWCKPDVLWLDPDTGLPWTNPDANPFVVHHAADCREIVERLIPGEPMEPGKTWQTIVV